MELTDLFLNLIEIFINKKKVVYLAQKIRTETIFQYFISKIKEKNIFFSDLTNISIIPQLFRYERNNMILYYLYKK